ncbi:hypothetical protein F5Y01DRAFT_327493 [Xylaria sp. FL0043]|nr:hypothetical protein F5Y01DRAFT_327493 [Xylaria sp. FL0043]
MRASTIASLSFAAFAAANPSNGPPNEDITLTVGAGSSLKGYQLVGFVDSAAAFPAFVTAAEAAESPSSTFSLFYVDYGHFGWYSLNTSFMRRFSRMSQSLNSFIRDILQFGYMPIRRVMKFAGPRIGDLPSARRLPYNSATYGLDVKPEAGTFEGAMILISSDEYGTNIWGPTNASPAFPWTGDSRDFPFACTNDDGHIQLAIYTPGTQPKNCEQIQLEYKAVA